MIALLIYHDGSIKYEMKSVKLQKPSSCCDRGRSKTTQILSKIPRELSSFRKKNPIKILHKPAFFIFEQLCACAHHLSHVAKDNIASTKASKDSIVENSTYH